MIEILGKKYISEKEASGRYGYSTAWFQKERFNKIGPPFCKIKEQGKVLYCIDDVDKWFSERLKNQY